MTEADKRFLVWIAGIGAVFCGLLLIPQSLRMTGHEADLLHVLDLSYRLAAGYAPHIDYPTPIGVLAYAPISALLDLGISPGRAILLAFCAALLVSLPFVLWASLSRLSGAPRWIFALFCVVMMGSLVHGGDEPSVSVSMYYNRWAWTLAFSLWILLFLPARPGYRAPLVDGLVLGLGFAALVLIKVSFAVGLLLPILVFIAQNRPWREVGIAAIAGGMVAVLVTGLGGFGLWFGYVSDLLLVSSSAERSYPSATLTDVLAMPRHLPGTALLLFAIIYWRKAGWGPQGLLLLASAPGFVFITYQNWGNDPKWLLLLGVLLLVFARTGPAERATTATAAALACLTLVAPTALNMAYAPLRHLALNPATYEPLMPAPSRADIEVQTKRNMDFYVLRRQSALMPDRLSLLPTPSDAPLSVNGEVLPECQARSGFVGLIRHSVAAIDALERADKPRAVMADLLGDFWLMSDLPLNPGTAPWFYDGTHGFATADLLVVPFCPFSVEARQGKLDGIAGLDIPLREVARTDHVILFEMGSPAR